MGWWLALPASLRSWVEKIFTLAAWSVLCVGIGAAVSWNYLNHKYKAEKLAVESAQNSAAVKMLQDNIAKQADVAKQLDSIRQGQLASQQANDDRFNQLAKDFHNELSKSATKCPASDRVVSLWYDSLRSSKDSKPGQADSAK